MVQGPEALPETIRDWYVQGGLREKKLSLGTKLRNEILPWSALGLPSEPSLTQGSKDADLGPVTTHIEGA